MMGGGEEGQRWRCWCLCWAGYGEGCGGARRGACLLSPVASGQPGYGCGHVMRAGITRLNTAGHHHHCTKLMNICICNSS